MAYPEVDVLFYCVGSTFICNKRTNFALGLAILELQAMVYLKLVSKVLLLLRSGRCCRKALVFRGTPEQSKTFPYLSEMCRLSLCNTL